MTSLLNRVTHRIRAPGFVGPLFACVCLWAVAYATDSAAGSSRGWALSLIVMIGGSYLLGQVGESIGGLPQLLYMFFWGLFLRNAFESNGSNSSVVTAVPSTVTATLKSIALTVILLRAGAGINLNAVKRMSGAVLRLSILPNAVEAATAALLIKSFQGWPWLWCFMCGFVLSAVSPAVVVPSIVQLQAEGYGAEKGIPSLVLAAASLDDVSSIAGFGVFLGFVFGSGSAVWAGLRAPVEVIGGLLGGYLLAWIYSVAMPSTQGKHDSETAQDDSRSQFSPQFRAIMLLCVNSVCVVGSSRLHLTAIGALGTLVTTACLQFDNRWGVATVKEAALPLKKIWDWIAQPALFVLMGAGLDLDTLSNGDFAGKAVAIILIAVIVRMAVALFTVMGTDLNLAERGFVSISWFPKATVQAALGSIPLDNALLQNDDKSGRAEDLVRGQQFLTIAALSIIMTAPLGAVLINTVGRKVLQKQTTAMKDIEVSQPDTQEEPTDTVHPAGVDSKSRRELPAQPQDQATAQV